jgi:hypothetical protein
MQPPDTLVWCITLTVTVVPVTIGYLIWQRYQPPERPVVPDYVYTALSQLYRQTEQSFDGVYYFFRYERQVQNRIKFVRQYPMPYCPVIKICPTAAAQPV